jgi:hypothetical protein
MAKNLNLKIDMKNIDLKRLTGSLKNIQFASLKKYASLFPSVALLLIACVIFVLTLLVGGSVGKKMGQSVQVSNKIQSKISQTSSEAQSVEVERYYQKYAEDVDKVDRLAVRTSQRELVCYNPVIFPEPVDKSSQVYIGFGKQFRVAIEELIRRIRAKDAPSDAEIRSRTGVGTAAAGGEGYYQTTVPTGPQSARVDAFCLQRADEIPVYANPAIFSWYLFWDKYTYQSKEQSLLDCWYSQLAFWIYEDVIQTIEALDAGSAKVSKSPVKRFLGIRFDGPVQVIPSNMAGSAEYNRGPGEPGLPGQLGQQQDIPTYVRGSSHFLQIPWTDRICNDNVDVVHFAVSVVVDSKSVSSFMKELCSAKSHTFREGFTAKGKQETASHNQITILQFYTEPVVQENAIHAYYRYGGNAVVQLNLVCEYLFIRQAYDAIKPAPIKAILEGKNTGQNPMGG